MSVKLRPVLVFLLTGVISGILAALIIDAETLQYYLIIAVTGAFVGGYFLASLGTASGIGNPLYNQIATSMFGAVVIIQLAQLVE